jgi:ubiquinone/menaquinone biosynthesis C-methylase UbiE
MISSPDATQPAPPPFEYTRGHWETYVANYASGRRRAKIALVLEWMGEVQGRRVLDVGIGAGFWTRTCVERGARVISLEFADALVDPYRGERRLRLVQGDAQRMPFPRETFDLVLLLDVIEHLPSARSCLEEVRRVLAPGGRLILVTDNTEPIGQRLLAPLDLVLRVGAKLWARLFRRGGPVPRLRAGPGCTHVREFSAQEIADLVEHAGFRLTDLRTYYDGYSFYALGAFLARIFPGRRSARLWDHTILRAERL